MNGAGLRVAILLSTFNGTRHLPAQLDSYRQQTEPGWILLWRDDGSSDGTPELMERFACEVGAARCRRVGGTERLGAAGSFYALLDAAVPLEVPVAFSDQDDIWLPHKLERGLAALAAAPGPALYCCAQKLVDEELRPLGVSTPIRRRPSFAGALTQNVATGCTVLLDPAAAALIAASVKPVGPLHDWWSYLLVAGAGGRVIADPEPGLLYRQHGTNAVGAPITQRRRALAALHRGPDAFMAMLRANLTALKLSRDRLTPEASRAVAMLDRALHAGVAARLRALLLPGLHRQTAAETALFRLWFLRG